MQNFENIYIQIKYPLLTLQKSITFKQLCTYVIKYVAQDSLMQYLPQHLDLTNDW